MDSDSDVVDSLSWFDLIIHDNMIDCSLPEELSGLAKRLSTSLSSLQVESESQLESLRQEYELYKKRSKAATALLQEKSGSISGQIDSLQNEVCLVIVDNR